MMMMMKAVYEVSHVGFSFYLLFCGLLTKQCSGQLVPALYVFGDSTVDVGNNNNLWTMARADFSPFGKDFDTRQATGRFSNGRLSVDYLANFLNLPLAPPYLQNKTGGFSQGVNFASAGSGILNSTGDVFGQHISMHQQVDFFADVRRQLITSYGLSFASNATTKSIFYISIGTNDYLKNYYDANTYYATQYSEENFQGLLLDALSQEIQRLYNLGARKIIVASLSPMGSIPSQLAKFKSVSGSPIGSLNLIAKGYNNGLQALLTNLGRELQGSFLIYNNVYDLLVNITSIPQTYGFKYSRSACCGLGRYGGALPCLPNLVACKNTSQHVFWDQYHPTSTTYYLLAKTFWDGGSTYSFPMDVKTLAFS